MYPLDGNDEDYEELLLYYAKLYSKTLEQREKTAEKELFDNFLSQLEIDIYLKNTSRQEIKNQIESKFDDEINKQISQCKNIVEKCDVLCELLSKDEKIVDTNRKKLYKIQSEQLEFADKQFASEKYQMLVGKCKSLVSATRDEAQLKKLMAMLGDNMTFDKLKDAANQSAKSAVTELKKPRNKYMQDMIDYYVGIFSIKSINKQGELLKNC